MSQSAIPTFYLYGEPHQQVSADFIHVEALDDRSRPSEWTIRPHAHAELSHLFLIARGGGSMSVDGCQIAFAAPALLLVPARHVHGFAWASESNGSVLTLSQQELDVITRGDAEIGALFAAAHAIPLDPDQAERAQRTMTALVRELGWSQPGRHAALRAGLLDLIVLALRGAPTTGNGKRNGSRHAALVARFRERIEERFRLREPVSRHAEALGTSESALRAACAAVAGQSPASMIDERAQLEARRALLYSDLSVAEIGFSVGFADPAYFSRFFTRHAGRSPVSYRRMNGHATASTLLSTS